MSALSGKILVTGGAGFIGSALVWELNRRGITNIVISDILGTDEKWKNLVPLAYADYVEADAFRKAINARADAYGKFSCIFHLGACSATTERNASYLADNNTAYTKELASWALTIGARFVYASSAATYGDGSAGMDDQSEDIAKLRPLNMYGYSKHLFDLYAQRVGWLPKIVGVKYFNVYGPNEDHKGDMRSLVNKAYAQIVSEGSVALFKSYKPEYKDGEQMRDFLYVKDAVKMTIHLAETGSAGGLYNLGSGEANTWVTLATAIFAGLGKAPNIRFIEMPEILRGKYQYYTKADISKLRSSGYKELVTPLASAVGDYVKHYMVPGKKLGE